MSVSFNVPLEIDEVTDLIDDIADQITVFVRSEPGVGKSSILKELAIRNGDAFRVAEDSRLPKCANDKYDYIYVDCASKDLNDIGLTIPNHGSRRLDYYVSELVMLDSPKPKVILLDEFDKCPRMTKIVFTRLTLERIWGDRPVPTGTKIFTASNNASDGFGDSMMGYEMNRGMVVDLLKPNANKWLRWAANNGIHPVICATAQMYGGRMFASYRDEGQKDNPYIFNPKVKQPFVSGRSMAAASKVVEKFLGRERLMLAALCGTVGVAAARDITMVANLNKQISTTEQVIANPAGITMPTDDAALFLMLFNAVEDVKTQDDLTKFMTFVERITSEEIQSVFFSMMFRRKSKIPLARGNGKMKDWSLKNYELI